MAVPVLTNLVLARKQNAVSSPAIEFKSEGYIAGLGAKLFIIAGPVIVYGVSASIIYGFVLWILSLFGVRLF